MRLPKTHDAKDGDTGAPIVAKPMRHRILRSFLLVSFLVIVSVAALFIIYMSRLRTMVERQTESFVVKAKGMFEKSMTDSMTKQLEMSVAERARLADDSMWMFKSRVNQVADFATQLYAHPERFVPRNVEPPYAENEGKVSLFATYAKGVNPNSPQIVAETKLLGAASDVLRFHKSDSHLIDEIFLETCSGISVIAGANVVQYIDDKGGPLPYTLGKEPYITEVFESGKPHFSSLLNDEFTKEIFVAYTVPVFKGKEVVGVACASMVNYGLYEVLKRIVDGAYGTACILDIADDGIGTIVYSTTKDGILGLNENDPKNDLRLTDNAELAKLVNECIQSEQGLTLMELDGEEHYVAFARIWSVGWSLIMTFPKNEVLAPVTTHFQRLQKNGETVISHINDVIVKVIISMFAVSLFLLILLPFIARRLSYLITKPMMLLTNKVCTLKGNDLSFSWEYNTKDETQVLAETFANLVGRVRTYVSDIVAVTSEKEKISTELGVATKIQADMLPKIFPAFPDRPEFEVFASMRPAKEVGGDFYDFFMVDKRHLAVVVADVSGKGVPAALFMVIGKTLIKDHTVPNVDLGKAFTEVNNLLFEANGDGMFITAFEGVLDLYSGEFSYVNAGHEPPYIWHDGKFVQRELEPAFVLAGMPGMKYHAGRVMLEPGDKIFQYTDGVTEATNAQEKLYGFERLNAVLNEHGNNTPCEIINSVTEDVDAFVGDAPQFDDITMLCLDYKQRMEVGQLMVHETLTVSAERENLARVQEFVTSTMKKGCASAESQSQIDIATEEVFINIASYAYPQAAADKPVWIDCVIKGNEMELSFKDSGVPYNPLEKSDPNIDVPVQEKTIGGLGIFMTKQLADSVEYEFSQGHNVLRLKKTIA